MARHKKRKYVRHQKPEPQIERDEFVASIDGKLYTQAEIVEFARERVAQINKDKLKLPPEPVTLEAYKIVYGRGEKEYGHPVKNFVHTARLLNAQFHDKLKQPLTPADVAYILIHVKMSRQNNMEKRDNMIDVCGYAETAQRVLDKESEWPDDVNDSVAATANLY